jgi:hypothetical protein|tara:strand:+ start:646 stop:768 length:123 start_codon:yes stop_codon:yes gene_type:complete
MIGGIKPRIKVKTTGTIMENIYKDSKLNANKKLGRKREKT